MSDIEFISRREEVEMLVKMALLRALNRCGEQAEGLAQSYLIAQDASRTGNLLNSITHDYGIVGDGGKMVVGTDMKYARYVEEGTGIYYPGGRREPWAYQDVNGQWHRTSGMRPRPYIKPCLANHFPIYKAIIESELKG